MSEGPKPQFKRVLLKLSGESLMGDDAFGINKETLSQIVADIREVIDLGVEMGIVRRGQYFPRRRTRLDRNGPGHG